ncbi:HpcH/HpaI aldolase/citrate lyase family protein [Pseudactinotalea terrae]|uniref:HpcH/HpaI aldolase/citrate lyase family protein n=1 Tax=Pseudactinotalea terrae TaxID=1743262 RepID=UPI0012E2EBFB|nr:CoA ester lyase [Pseudactinotalea terrae]
MASAAFDLGPALLFCPADRPDRYRKAAERADAVILDLEDAVAPTDKPGARAALTAHLLDPARTIVRVNSVLSGELEADLLALADTPYRTVMLAKTESASDVGALVQHDVLALVETALGVVNAAEIAAADGVVGLMWGAEDLVASLGGTSSRWPDGRYRHVAAHARSSVLLAAGAHGRAAIDAVHTDLDDPVGLRIEAEDAVASGFTATACLHPDQVEVIRSAYRPGADRIVWAEAVLTAARSEPGAFRFEGQMIDEPVLALARRVLARSS